MSSTSHRHYVTFWKMWKHNSPLSECNLMWHLVDHVFVFFLHTLHWQFEVVPGTWYNLSWCDSCVGYVAPFGTLARPGDSLCKRVIVMCPRNSRSDSFVLLVAQWDLQAATPVMFNMFCKQWPIPLLSTNCLSVWR